MWLLFVATLWVGCSDDPLDPTQQKHSELSVSLTVSPDSMGPGDWAEIRLVVIPEDADAQITSLRLVASGAFNDVVTVDVPNAGMIDTYFHLDVHQGRRCGSRL